VYAIITHAVGMETLAFWRAGSSVQDLFRARSEFNFSDRHNESREEVSGRG
jgi:hypothetical protein